MTRNELAKQIRGLDCRDRRHLSDEEVIALAVVYVGDIVMRDNGYSQTEKIRESTYEAVLDRISRLPDEFDKELALYASHEDFIKGCVAGALRGLRKFSYACN
jgi:hypothetical protein